MDFLSWLSRDCNSLAIYCMKSYNFTEPKFNKQGACVMAPDEPKSSMVSPIILTILVFVFLLMILAIPLVIYIKAPAQPTSNSNTVIHDTIIIHDTVRIEQTPVTFICHGICNGIEDFSRN